MSYPIAVIGADADEARKLRARRIRTAEGLLEAAGTRKGAAATRRGHRHRREQVAVPRQLRRPHADQRSRQRVRRILPAVGVDTVKELKYRNPEKLAHAIAELNKRRKLVRFLPTVNLVTRWIEHAKKLPLKITYR